MEMEYLLQQAPSIHTVLYLISALSTFHLFNFCTFFEIGVDPDEARCDVDT